MNFGSGGAGGDGGGAANVSAGPDLEQIETEYLAFQSVSGEDKLRLLPAPWPSDSLPSTTASLLSIASTKGLVAAAGPDTLVVTSTESIRQTFVNEMPNVETKVKSYTPQLTLSVPRVNQVCFSSDESCLVIAAEQGGGLAVYDTSSLVNEGKEAAFQLATEGESVRQLFPNPNPSQDTSRYFGVVTENGKLLLADLKERTLVKASNGGTVFYENVSCGCWSRLGKQIVVGLANGTAVQLDPSGAVKARIPEPPQLAELRQPSSQALPITSIFWLETHDFLIIHTPINPSDSGADDDSIYHLAHRGKQSNAWIFSKFMDPCPPFGVERRPASHFVQRLRDWASLNETIMLASTASTDIGLFTKSKEPLDPSQPYAIDVFTYTQPPDQRRAAMPMGEESDTSPIGMALDLSTNEKIIRPIPNDESLDKSPIPLPALYVLNNEGMLSMWWIVYNEAIRKNVPYPDLIAAGGPRSLEQPKQQQQPSTSNHAHPTSPAQQMPSSTSPFGTFGNTPSAPAQKTPAFGQSSFGTPSTPAFGGTSNIGSRQSPWGAPSSVATGTGSGGTQFGKSTFGQPSSFGQSSFGQIGGMGANKGSVWGAHSQQQEAPQQSPTAGISSGSVFGGNAGTQSPFMSLGGSKAPSGFAGLGSGNKDNQPSPSPFATASKPTLPAEPSGSTVSFGNQSSFGSGSTTFGIQSQPSFGSPSAFGKPSAPASREESMGDDASTTDTASTAKPTNQQAGGGLFGLPSGGFKLGSTFKGDGSAKDDGPKPENAGAGLFGKGFGDALGETSKASTPSTASAATNVGIKKEPGTENEGPKLQDIPPAEPTKKAAPPVDDAPLPPDPTTWKPKAGALPAPVPPGFESAFGKKGGDEEKKAAVPPNAPLLPDSISTKDPPQQNKDSNEGPLAGSPPVDLGQEKFSEGVPSGSEAEGPEEDEWSDEEGDEDEGEGDEGEESAEEQGTPEIKDQKGLSAFEARLTPASPKRGEPQRQRQEESTTPATDKKESYTPAGLPKPSVIFAPPQRKGQESPRSPSPVRSATSPVRAPPSFGSAQPPLPPASKPSQPPSATSSRAPSSQQVPFSSSQQSRSTAQAQPPQRIAVTPAQIPQKPQKPQAPPKPAEPDAGQLEDEEDARIQSVLSAPIEPTKHVPSFLAHQDYVVSGAEKPGLGGQIERVYRDINSMIDTLALNARSLRGFVEGNMMQEHKGRLELENEEGWVLGEGSDLADVVEGIETELEDGKLEDVRGALEELQEEEKQLSTLRTKTTEVRKRIAARRDPEQLAQHHASPLPMETQTLQTELRQEVQRVQKLMAKAEEVLGVLRAELASHQSSQQASGAEGSGVPTVEAVERTIRKMTRMVEERSGDVDVLEAKIRRLGGPSALPGATSTNGTLEGNYEDDLSASMKASRLSHSSPAAALKASRISAYGSPSVARRSQRAGTPGTVGSSSGMKKGFMDVSNEEVEAFWVKKEARRQAMARLKETIDARGQRVVRVGEA